MSRTGVLFQAVEETVSTGSAVSTAFAQEGESYGVHLLTDVTQDPVEDPSQEPSDEPSSEPGAL